MRRKKLWKGPSKSKGSNFKDKWWSFVLLIFQWTSGYAERPPYVLYWSLACLFGFAFAYLPYTTFDFSFAGASVLLEHFFLRGHRAIPIAHLGVNGRPKRHSAATVVLV